MAEILPDIRWLDSKPELVEFISSNRSGDRVMQNFEYSDPFWRIPMITPALTQAERLTLEGFKQIVGNGMVTVLYQPKHICLPRAYWGDPTNPAVLNTGNLVSVTGKTITVNSVTDGLTLQPGDLIGFSTSGFIRNTIVQVSNGAVASGGAITFVAGPTLPDYITAGATVLFKDPIMNTRVVPNSFDIPSSKWAQCSFELQEVPL